MGNSPRPMNIISQKYDATLDYHVTMYDNLPYKRDTDYCNVEKVALYSGRVIKFYLCMNQQEKILIDNKDDQIEQILEEIRLAEKKRLANAVTDTVRIADSTEVTQEQIQSLLDDNKSLEDFSADEAIDDNDVDAAENAVNAFSDVEDW